MVWFKVDDSFDMHPKVLAAGNSAIGLWVRTGAYCMRQLTDGFVPAAVALMFGTPAEVEHLVHAGLWEVTDGGFRFHDWDQSQPSAETVKAARRANAERQAHFREKALEAKRRNAVTNASVTELVTVPPTRPDPTRPESSYEDSSQGAKSKKKPEVPLPKDWMPTASHRALAAKRGLNLDWQAERFREHAEAHDRHCVTWNAAFTTWLNKADPKRDGGTRSTDHRRGPDAWMYQ